ncbi:Crp/Fnr family transcriptional regulator [Mucilaginibacter sp. UR6-1]|uniref:Crp/Fnr family transcriptional regulator n=1 Tax=Mucilaginibacter sp. UR6-1 TaxID=1435643 RepID=UPI001E293709|nr:Crp/Fnr family transcriptional regulator [Mucilaginibacter sp. UR6-1]MCC8409753.1 Crp/Fnr family transcriptional regulator [Mucilaginibacter sp. UR6-1]
MDQVNQLQAFKQHVESYVLFNADEWLELEKYLTYIQLKKKDYFVEKGKVCQYFGFIAAGSVRYFNIRNDGEEITNFFSFANELVSSYKSFVKQQPSIIYVQALEDTSLVCISHSNIQKLTEHPLLAHKMERFGRLVAEYYLCCYEDRVQAFITQSPEERYVELLKDGQDVLQRIPQHYVANYLGVTPVSLSRIRKRIFIPAK